MTSLLSDYNERKRDIEGCKTFVANSGLKSDMEKIMKSNFYLMAYNTLESVITGLIFEINDDIKKSNSSYMLLNDAIKKMLHQYYFHGKEKFDDDKITKIISSLINGDSITIDSGLLLQKLKLFSGNLDHRKITHIFKLYNINNINSEHKEDILKIKDMRNRLAHGEVSFSNCCRDESVEATLKTVYNMFSYLDKIIENISNYITDKKYLL